MREGLVSFLFPLFPLSSSSEVLLQWTIGWREEKEAVHPKKWKSLIITLPCLDKAPRLSISIVIWILSSDTDTDTDTSDTDTDICQLNQFNTNSEAAMLSNHALNKQQEGPFGHH